MCHINFLWVKNGLKQRDLSFLDTITYNSFNTNSDGEGFLTTNMIIKRSEKKVIPSKHAELIIGQPFIIFHERLSTHGKKNAENTQPIKIKDIIFVHNGIMYGNFDKDKSDSYLVCEKITKEIEATKNPDFPKILKNVFENEYGSKSVFVFNQKNGELFYYKNYSTTFYFVQSKDFLFCSTSKENVEYAKLFYDANYNKICETSDDTLFKVNYDFQSCSFDKICKIEHTYGSTTSKSFGRIDRWIEEDKRNHSYYTGGQYCGEAKLYEGDDDYKIVHDEDFNENTPSETEQLEEDAEDELGEKVFVLENFLKGEGITDFVINTTSNRLTMTCKADEIFDKIALRNLDITSKLDNVTRRFYVFDLDEFIQIMGLI